MTNKPVEIYCYLAIYTLSKIGIYISSEWNLPNYIPFNTKHVYNNYRMLDHIYVNTNILCLMGKRWNHIQTMTMMTKRPKVFYLKSW